MNHGGTEDTEIVFKELTGALIGAAIEVHREGDSNSDPSAISVASVPPWLKQP